MNIITSPYDLTPIEKHDNILFKRDDLFRPYEINSVNGGKLRQCIFLLKENANKKQIYAYSNLDSPQSPIVAAVCKNMNLSCNIFYGGSNLESAMKHHMPRLVKFYNANINFNCKSGRHSVLKHLINQIITDDDFLVEYGINLNNYKNALLLSTANQVQNLPKYLNNLVITCGSGISAAGILIGLEQYHKKVNNIFLINTAPNRDETIKKILNQFNININFNTLDLFHTENFKYEKKENFIFDKIKLHPNYEAKTLKYFLETPYNKEKTLFWIIGAYPELDVK